MLAFFFSIILVPGFLVMYGTTVKYSVICYILAGVYFLGSASYFMTKVGEELDGIGQG